MAEFQYILGIIGAGNMSGAITDGILRVGKLDPKRIIVGDIDAEKLDRLKKSGFAVTSDNKFLAENSQNVLFAVKPQVFESAANEIKSGIKAEAVLSVMAGVGTAKLAAFFANPIKICRVMPNTPCMIGKGICALTFAGYSDGEKKFVFDIFDALGETVELSEEKFDAVTAVSGSGPAYVYSFIDAVIKGGVEKGLTFGEAKKLTVSVFKGAAELAERSEKSLDELIKNVASKGGTTEAALKIFAERGVADGIREGVFAAAERSKELGK
ncbi:MAG: pyrroline-5-carboxylate reductase [Clostridiales bacterium]|jgi:pyrroline-5-carboxylate reductase|nr:pyrroline-5-carboxylate reductase [Clostridiales bacterium]